MLLAASQAFSSMGAHAIKNLSCIYYNSYTCIHIFPETISFWKGIIKVKSNVKY